jgi:hypothetical protein
MQRSTNKINDNNNIITGSVLDINKHISTINSSPAYLDSHPNDRIKQLGILDNAMFGTNIAKKIRAGSEMNQS